MGDLRRFHSRGIFQRGSSWRIFFDERIGRLTRDSKCGNQFIYTGYHE
jgi:hypothetical protein